MAGCSNLLQCQYRRWDTSMSTLPVKNCANTDAFSRELDADSRRRCLSGPLRQG